MCKGCLQVAGALLFTITTSAGAFAEEAKETPANTEAKALAPEAKVPAVTSADYAATSIVPEKTEATKIEMPWLKLSGAVSFYGIWNGKNGISASLEVEKMFYIGGELQGICLHPGLDGLVGFAMDNSVVNFARVDVSLLSLYGFRKRYDKDSGTVELRVVSVGGVFEYDSTLGIETIGGRAGPILWVNGHAAINGWSEIFGHFKLGSLFLGKNTFGTETLGKNSFLGLARYAEAQFGYGFSIASLFTMRFGANLSGDAVFSGKIDRGQEPIVTSTGEEDWRPILVPGVSIIRFSPWVGFDRIAGGPVSLFYRYEMTHMYYGDWSAPGDNQWHSTHQLTIGLNLAYY